MYICISGIIAPSELTIHQKKLRVVLMYYTSALIIKKIEIIFLPGCICCDLKIWREICRFVSLYRFLDQSQDEFEVLLENI